MNIWLVEWMAAWWRFVPTEMRDVIVDGISMAEAEEWA